MRAGVADKAAVDSFFRRQLVLAAVAGAVVLAGLVTVAAFLAAGEPGDHAVLRPAAGESGVEAASPLAESSRAAVRAAGIFLVAVTGLFAVLVAHMVGVVKLTFLRPGGRSPKEGAEWR